MCSCVLGMMVGPLISGMCHLCLLAMWTRSRCSLFFLTLTSPIREKSPRPPPQKCLQSEPRLFRPFLPQTLRFASQLPPASLGSYLCSGTFFVCALFYPSEFKIIQFSIIERVFIEWPPKELGAGSQRWLCTSDLMTGLGPEPLIYSFNKHSARQPQVANSHVGKNTSTQGNPSVPDASSFVGQWSSVGRSPTQSTAVPKSPGPSSLPPPWPPLKQQASTLGCVSPP